MIQLNNKFSNNTETSCTCGCCSFQSGKFFPTPQPYQPTTKEPIAFRPKPHKCPLCKGTGRYDDHGTLNVCHACDGKGIVWG